MRVEYLVVGKRYRVDGKGTVGVFDSVNPRTGGLRFKIEGDNPYIEEDGLTGFRPVSAELITSVDDEPTN